MLTLKDFVKETLTEVVDALTEFTEERKETGASANPPISNQGFKGRTDIIEGQYISEKSRYETIVPVTFDVAITAIDDATTKGRAGLQVVSIFKADGSIEHASTTTNANRVQFTVPLRLPETGHDGSPRTSLKIKTQY